MNLVHGTGGTHSATIDYGMDAPTPDYAIKDWLEDNGATSLHSNSGSMMFQIKVPGAKSLPRRGTKALSDGEVAALCAKMKRELGLRGHGGEANKISDEWLIDTRTLGRGGRTAEPNIICDWLIDQGVDATVNGRNVWFKGLSRMKPKTKGLGFDLLIVVPDGPALVQKAQLSGIDSYACDEGAVLSGIDEVELGRFLRQYRLIDEKAINNLFGGRQAYHKGMKGMKAKSHLSTRGTPYDRKVVFQLVTDGAWGPLRDYLEDNTNLPPARMDWAVSGLRRAQEAFIRGGGDQWAKTSPAVRDLLFTVEREFKSLPKRSVKSYPWRAALKSLAPHRRVKFLDQVILDRQAKARRHQQFGETSTVPALFKEIEALENARKAV